ELVERFGSPLYAFDAAVLRDRIAAVQAALGPRVDVLLAIKANPNVALCRVARVAGCGADVASAGEVRVALASGFAGTDLHFAGPCKADRGLEAGFEAAVGHVNLDSAGEYERVAHIARERPGVPAPGVAIRVNPNLAQSGSRLRMAEPSSRFGVDREHVVGLARRIVEERTLPLRGLHVYAGSQSFDADAWAAGARSLCELAADVERATGMPLSSLNFG